MPRARSTPTPSSGPARGSGELALIERIRQRAAAASRSAGAVRLGIGDDAAILAPPRGYEIVVTTDMSLEGRHFRRDWHLARAVGHRALARGLSDLAAMGARPLAAFLSLALPKTVASDPQWLDEFLDGLLGLAGACKVPLAGGDMAESPSDHVLADIVLLGVAPAGKALRRSGATPGDRLFLTGALGGAAAELASLAASNTRAANTRENDAPGKRRSTRRIETAEHPHLYPQPRLAVGQSLLRRGLVTASIDVSDGLSTDLAHLCAASEVAAEIEAAKLPLHPLARALGADAALQAALHGGEDYELLVTVPADALVPRSLAGVPITCIGKIVRAKRDHPAMTLIEADGRRTPLEPCGWEHLR
jgi:thiamine-monophosphate kinase